MSSTIVSAYWPSRPQTREECSEALGRTLRGISSLIPECTEWYLKATSRAEAKNSSVPSAPALLQAYLQTNNTDTDGRAISHLGFRFGAWNGNDIFSASLTATCGATSRAFWNCVV